MDRTCFSHRCQLLVFPLQCVLNHSNGLFRVAAWNHTKAWPASTEESQYRSGTKNPEWDLDSICRCIMMESFHRYHPQSTWFNKCLKTISTSPEKLSLKYQHCVPESGSISSFKNFEITASCNQFFTLSPHRNSSSSCVFWVAFLSSSLPLAFCGGNLSSSRGLGSRKMLFLIDYSLINWAINIDGKLCADNQDEQRGIFYLYLVSVGLCWFELMPKHACFHMGADEQVNRLLDGATGHLSTARQPRSAKQRLVIASLATRLTCFGAASCSLPMVRTLSD